MQGLPLVYLFLYFILIFFFLGGGGGSAKLMFGYNMGVFGGWWGPKLWMHRPGWRFWLCPVELADVPGWQMTTRHSFPRLGPNPRVITVFTLRWLGALPIAMAGRIPRLLGAYPGRTGSCPGIYASYVTGRRPSPTLLGFQLYAISGRAHFRHRPMQLRAIHRRWAHSQAFGGNVSASNANATSQASTRFAQLVWPHGYCWYPPARFNKCRTYCKARAGKEEKEG